MPFVVALTGGIGSGKSLASEHFARLGADVIDTDRISRELTGPDGPALPAIVRYFGSSVLAPDGSLNRRHMRQRIFSDPQARRQLESILHPMIREEAERRVAASTAPYVILVVPLLFEGNGFRNVVKRVAVVDCDEERQVERVMRRDSMSREDALSILRTQAPRHSRLAGADDIITNNGKPSEVLPQVEQLHERYLAIAGHDRQTSA